jgi:ABC-2 type transport system ATP-binding protein
MTQLQLQSPGFGASGLRVCYRDIVALADVSLAVARGEVTAVVGGDGAGKTSLLRCLAGALRPDAGEVRSPGSQRVGYLPASSGVYPDLTVAENLAFRAAAYRMPGAAAAERTAELIARAGLSAARNRLAGQLSGGMRQKLGVIAALMHRPDLLILDEPSTGVDPVSRSGLWSLIASAAADGAAVVLATTYIDDAQRASTVLVLDAGRQLAAGRPEQIVAAMPGSVVVAAEPPAGQVSLRAWRRGASWRVWCPPGTSYPGEPVPADLQDAVTVAALARTLHASPAAGVEPAEPADHAQPDPAEYVQLVETAENVGPVEPAGYVQPSDPAGRFRPAEPTEYVQIAPASDARRRAAPTLAESIAVTCVFGQVTAVRDVSIQVRRGEIVGLLGANGAGKTTLIRMLLGLIPATTGQILLLGERPSRQTRRRIGYVPQGLGLYDDLTVAENLQFAAAVFGSRAATGEARHHAHQQAAEAAAQLGGSPLPVSQLPLGLQRRAAFAEALAHQPELLILDEPTSGVDPLGRARLWQTISGAVQAGAGALVSTHYMEEAGECDRLIIMAEGEVVAAGTAEQIIGAAQVTVVEAANWHAAFSALERAGLPVALAGRTLRVPGAGPDVVGLALASGAARQRGDRVYEAPATLEERFFDLTLSASRHQVPE